MPVRFSPVVGAKARRFAGFTSLHAIDLAALGVYESPLMVVDDFRVEELPFSPHPHAGFVAATYVFRDSEGDVRSRASTGADLTIGPGGIVWTQTGSGLVHEEVPAQPGREVHGLQLFVNVSAEGKASPPEVRSLDGPDVPEWVGPDDDLVRVVVGTFDGVASPLQPDESFTLLDVELRHALTYRLEAGHNTVVYTLGGRTVARSADRSVEVGGGQALALSGADDLVALEANGPASLLVLTGAAIG